MNKEINTEKQSVLDWFNNSKCTTPMVVCGKAGTGKTTLIKEIATLCNEQKKLCAITAPTGVAAYNIGLDAVTIHSFFSIPPFDYILKDEFQLSAIARGYKLRQRVKNISLIIIDEISMVRADMIDALDFILRAIKGNEKPFGGIKTLLVGDFYQLPPILQYREKQEFYTRYKSEFFFHSNVVINAKKENNPFLLVELNKIYRQNDDIFVNFLNDVRLNRIGEDDIDFINQRVIKKKKERSNTENFELRIATLKNVVAEYNNSILESIDKPLVKNEAIINEIHQKFPANMYPTDCNLDFKIGSQIMFINNDSEKRWVNGTLGKIIDVNGKIVLIHTDRNENLEVTPHTFMFNGYLDGSIKTLATFIQYPFRLAWAITIHKSQGLTFDDVTIDFCNSVFASGMAYVALSRCRTLEGIKLVSPMQEDDIKVNSSLKTFKNYFCTDF